MTKTKKLLLICSITILILLCSLTYLLTGEYKNVNVQKVNNLDLSLSTLSYSIDEMDYETQMTQTVVPYLEKRKETGYFNSNDASIYYETYLIPDSIGSVVISHGFTEFTQKYRETIYYFLKEGFSVFILDHRGHGYSSREVTDLSMVYVDNFDQYVEDLCNFTKEIVKPLNVDKECYLFAHSMGGGIGIRALEEEPDLYDKAILTGPMCDPITGFPKRLSHFVSNVVNFFGFSKEYLPGHGTFEPEPNFTHAATNSEPRYLYNLSVRTNDKKYETSGACFSWLKASLDGTDELMKKENLERIKTPILLFQAEDDTYVKPQVQNVFVNSVDSAKMVFVPNEKHELYAAPNEVLIPYFNTIFSFLEE